MSMVPEDMPEGGGPHGDAAFGQVSQTQKLTRDMQSNTGPSQQPGGQPPQPQQPQEEPPSQQPVPSPVQPQPVGNRLDPANVFSKPRVGQDPKQDWRTFIRQWANHPQAGWGLGALANAIKDQRGPLDQK